MSNSMRGGFLRDDATGALVLAGSSSGDLGQFAPNTLVQSRAAQALMASPPVRTSITATPPQIPAITGTGTGSTTSGSNQLTGVTVSTGTFVNGATITGAGIPAGTVIQSGAGTATITLSKNATATAAGVAVSTTYVGSKFVPLGSPLLRVSGTTLVPSVFGTTAPGTPSAQGFYTSSGRTAAPSAVGGAPWRIEFVTDGAWFAIPVGSPLAASPAVRVFVDNQLVSADHEVLTGSGSGDGGTPHKWTFATAAVRQITVELVSASASGVYVPIDAQILEVPWPRGPKVLWVGDSVTEGAVASSMFRGHAHVASWLLGFDNFTISAVGGTGYTAFGTAGQLNTVDRLQTDVLDQNPDLIIWALGVNDGLSDTATTKANAKACYLAAKARGIKQIVLGAYWAEYTASRSQAVNTVLRQAAVEVGIPYIETMDADRWVRGTGHAGTPSLGYAAVPTFDGNADRYQSGGSDGTAASQSVHPSSAGHDALGRWEAGRIADVIKAAFPPATPAVPPPSFPISTAPSAWFKADAITGLADAAAVSSWVDSSPSGVPLTQATGANQPTYRTNVQNGQPVVRFDGVNDLLQAASAVAVKHVFAVAKFNGLTFDNNNAIINGNAGVDNNILLHGDGSLRRFYRPPGGIVTRAWRNGEERTAELIGPFNWWAILEIASVASWAATMTLLMGSRSGGRFWNGDIGEVLIYPSVLGDTDRSAVIAYLKNKWGIL